MEKTNDNPLRRFDRQKPNYALLAAAAVLMAILLVAAVFAIRSGEVALAVLSLAAAAVFVVVGLLDIANRRRLEALDDRKFIRWDAAMPEVDEEEYYLPTTRLDVVTGIVETLRARAEESGMGDVTFTPEDYKS